MKNKKQKRKDCFESGWYKLFSVDSTLLNFKSKNFILETK